MQLSQINGLGDLNPVVIIAAITGITISAGVLSRFLGLEEVRLQAALKHGEAMHSSSPESF